MRPNRATRYEIVKTKITLPPERIEAGLAALAHHFHDAQVDRLDGLRLDWPGKWLLVRASNTEPIVRAIAEAPSESEARRLCDEAGSSKPSEKLRPGEPTSAAQLLMTGSRSSFWLRHQANDVRRQRRRPPRHGRGLAGICWRPATGPALTEGDWLTR